MLLFMERNNDYETVLQLVKLDIQRYCFFFCPIPLQKGYILAKYIQFFMFKTFMLILQDLRKIHYSQAQYDFFSFCLIDDTLWYFIDVGIKTYAEKALLLANLID